MLSFLTNIAPVDVEVCKKNFVGRGSMRLSDLEEFHQRTIDLEMNINCSLLGRQSHLEEQVCSLNFEPLPPSSRLAGP